MPLAVLDIKLAFSIVAFIVGVVAFIPYIKDTLAGRTKPHAYTWLIWSITVAVAAAGVWYGSGGYTAVNLAIMAALTGGVFFLSLAYGTRNVTRSDAVLLALVLAAIIPWLIFKDPTFSVLMVTAIDMAGYFPSMRKSYAEPWSESLSSWALFTVTGLFLLLALNTYNIITMIYIFMSIIMNVILIGICLTRRRSIPKPLD